MNHPSHNI